LDWKYLYFLVSFCIGVLAGFQGIYNRFKQQSSTAVKTSWGVLYLLSRGVLATTLFLIAIINGVVKSKYLLWALVFGATSEIALRTQFYIRETTKGGRTSDLLKGPFDLVKWYQDFFLVKAQESSAQARKRFIKSNLPESVSFPDLCVRAVLNLNAYPAEQMKMVTVIASEVAKLRDKYKEDCEKIDAPSRDQLNKEYCIRLGYAVLNAGGEKAFQILLVEEPTDIGGALERGSPVKEITGIVGLDDSPPYYAETYEALFELERVENDFIWVSTTTRKLRFLNRFKGKLTVRDRPDRPPPIGANAPPVEVDVKLDSGSKNFGLSWQLNEATPASFEVEIEIQPPPEKDDLVEFTVSWRSRYSTPVYRDEALTPVTIGDKTYPAYAGVNRRIPTKHLSIQFRFPSEYGLKAEDVTPIVAMYSQTVEFLHKAELERISVRKTTYFGNLVVDLEVNEARRRYLYGIAWMPPFRPGSNS
jgi:hypothetical protein